MAINAPSSRKEPQKRQLAIRLTRFKVLCLGVLALFIAIVCNLIYIQVLNGERYQKMGQKLRSQSAVLYHRGKIVDRNGVILAQDTILYDVFAHPRYFYKTPREEIAHALAPALNQPEADVLKKLQKPYDTISLAKNLTKPQAKAIIKLRLPGIDVPRKMIRRYPQGSLASHLIGYVNDDASISTGIEHTAEKTLRTAPVMAGIELNGRGDFMNIQNIRPDWVTDIPKAQDVRLTIDSRIQFVAESALKSGLERTKAKRGAVIIMKPQTGELLAFAVSPDFNPETYSKANPEQLKNWAITDVYPPGSTFKILTIACGLETGVINRNSRLHDTGLIKMHGFTIKNYDYGKHGAPGSIDLVYLFQHSSNIGSLLVSLMMDPADHHRLIQRFGFGSRTRIDIPGESAGILHPPSGWDELTHATIGYGYGLAATPIQMASAISAIANKGVWVTPHLVQGRKDIARRRVLSEETAKTVTELLAESIETAKTSTVRLEGYRVAGKTGTSRRPAENGRGYTNQLFTSFVGYFPAEAPKVLVMVVVDSPGIGEAWGSTVAGPIFKDIAGQIVGYLGLKPNQAVVSTKPDPAIH